MQTMTLHQIGENVFLLFSVRFPGVVILVLRSLEKVRSKVCNDEGADVLMMTGKTWT